MIDAKRLLDDLKRLLKRLEDDLRQRATSVEAMQAALQREYAAAKEAGRAGGAFEVWREGIGHAYRAEDLTELKMKYT